MKYFLSIFFTFVSAFAFADNAILYYEINGLCPGLYQTQPTTGCNSTTISSVKIPTSAEGVFNGYYVDGVQIIDENGNVTDDAVDVLSGLGNRGAEQSAIAQFSDTETDSIYGPWTVNFYAGSNTGTPLFTRTYKRNPKWNAGSGNATYIGLMKRQTGIENGVVHGWCTDPSLGQSTCVTDAGNCVSGCLGRLQITIPWDASGDKSYYAWLDCDKGYHQVNYACVKDSVVQTEQISEAECLATNGIWDGTNCKYAIQWTGGSCTEYKDNYYIAGRKNYVRCGNHSDVSNAGLGGKLLGWCLDPSLNSTCTDDTYGSVVIPANARGNIHFYAKITCASGFEYNQNTGKCDRLGSDFGEWNINYVCSTGTLWGCNTSDKCSAKNGLWDADNHMCASQNFYAQNNNSIWPIYDCHSSSTCVGDNQTPEQDCNLNGGTWANGQCTYRVTFIHNSEIPYDEERSDCDTTYVAGQTTTITCNTNRWLGTFFGWCLDDQLTSACNATTNSKSVIIPATAKGDLVYYAKWQCNDHCWSSSNRCLGHIYEATYIENTPSELVYNCDSDNTSGCRNSSECVSVGGTWDSVASICYKDDTFNDGDRWVTLKFNCGTGTLRRSDHPIPNISGRVGDFIQIPNAYEYCQGKPYTGANFTGWSVGRGNGNAVLTWDSGQWVRIPKTTSSYTTYNVKALWDRGNEHWCPDNYPQQPNTNLHYNGTISIDDCPKVKCGNSHFYGSWPSCTVSYGYSTHRQFAGWCTNSNWTGCVTNPFTQYTNTSQFWNNNYYDKWTCVDGWTLDSNKDCVCNQQLKNITYDTTGSSGGLSSNCPKVGCGDTPLASFNMSSCKVQDGFDGKNFEAWCKDEARTDCPSDLQFVGGNTYYAKYTCMKYFHDDGNGNCVKD